MRTDKFQDEFHYYFLEKPYFSLLFKKKNVP